MAERSLAEMWMGGDGSIYVLVVHLVCEERVRMGDPVPGRNCSVGVGVCRCGFNVYTRYSGSVAWYCVINAA